MWESIEYAENILDEIMDMTIENYGRDNDISKKNFITHEYFQNPAGNAYIKLAYDKENSVLAGQYVVIPMKMKVIDKEYPIILSLNTLTRESYRGQKIFITLAEEVYEECRKKGYMFCYGAPNPNSHSGFLRRLGFRDIGIMPLFLKIIHPSLLVKQKLGRSFLEFFAKPFDVLGRTKKIRTKYDIISIDKNNIGMLDGFWQRIREKYLIMGVRNSEFFSWRYLDVPEREYRILAVQEENVIKGYIVGRITEIAGMKCGMIVDFLVEKKRDAAAAVLLNRIQEECRVQGVGLMGCLMQRHFEEAKWLRKGGFFTCPKFLEPQPFPIIFRQLNEMDDTEQLNNFDNWFFTMGDYDVI